MLDLIQDLLFQGRTNTDILETLSVEHGMFISLSTLKRWIKSGALERPHRTTALDRSDGWIEEVRAMVKSGITISDILSHLQKHYNENISQRTLEQVMQVINIQ